MSANVRPHAGGGPSGGTRGSARMTGGENNGNAKEQAMRTMMRAGALAIPAMLALGGAAGAGTGVVIGEQNWTGASAVQHVLAEVMTRYLGADVTSIAAAEETLYPAMDRGDGTVDIVADMWTDHLTAQMQAYVLPGGSQSIKLNARSYQGTEGLFIPGYVQDKHDVRSVADLSRPEVAKLFDTDGNGKGEWWPGATGWEATNHSMVRAKTYGFGNGFETADVEAPVMLAQLEVAYQRQQPILLYYWTPEMIHVKYDLRRLDEPKFDGYATDDYKGQASYNPSGCYTFYQPNVRPDWLEASEIDCEQPPTNIHVAYTAALAERDPKIGRFLHQVSFSAATVTEWIRAIDVEGRPAAEVAEAWVTDNKALVEGEWLKGVL